MKIYTYLHTYKFLKCSMGVANNNEEKREYVVILLWDCGASGFLILYGYTMHQHGYLYEMGIVKWLYP